MLKINLEYRKGILFIRLKGNLNANTAPRLKEYALSLIKDHKIKYMVYNLNNLANIDSIGEDVLLESSKCVKFNKGKVLIINNNKLKFDNISNELVALDLLKI